MEELYWITRLDYVHNIFMTLFIISACILIALIIVYIGITTEYKLNNKDCKRCKKHLIMLSVLIVVSVCVVSFVPSTKDCFIIYGAGGTIDYLKSKDTAKKIPDKVVNSLDKLLNEYLKEDK